MFCEVFCYYTQKDWSKIEDILKNFDEKITIITTNAELKNFLIKKGFSAYTLFEKFLHYDNKKQKMERDSRIKLAQYRDAFTQIKYKNIEIFDGIESYILDQFTILEKTKLLLEEKSNFIFIFEYFLHTLFAIKKIAIDLHYDTDNNLRIVNKNQIKIITFEKNHKILYIKNFIFFMLPKNFPRNRIWNRKNSSNISERKKISLTLNFQSKKHLKKYIIKKVLREIKIIIFSFFYNMFYDFGIDSSKFVLKKVDAKLINELSNNYNNEHEKKNLSKNIGTKYCFFLTTNDVDLYLKPIYPIFDKFKKENVRFIIFTIDDKTSSILCDKKIPFINIYEELFIFSKILKKSSSCQKLIKQIKKIGDENELFLFNSKIPDRMWNRLFQTFSAIHIFEYLFSKNQINSIVSQIDANFFGNIATSTAKKFGIPNFTIPAAIINEQLSNSTFYHAEKILLYGKQGYDTLKKFGYDEKRLIITGNPRYDFFKNINHQNSKNSLNENYNIDKSKKLIVIAMSRWHQNDENWMSDFIQFCYNNNFEVILKIHPMYQSSDRVVSDDKISKIKNRCKDIPFLTTYDIDMYLLLSASDLVITEHSNVGVEAIFLGKPVISVNFNKEKFEGEQLFSEFECVMYFEKYPEMEKAVKDILYEKKLNNFLAGQNRIISLFNAYNDGKASERIFNLLTNNDYS